MATSAEQMRKYAGPALFSFAFRPFFLSGAMVAAIIPILTALSMTGVVHVGADPIAYHTHEMIYGFLPAIVAGFLFTAVPNWTGRLPIVGGRLVALFTLWLAGRAAIALSGATGALVAGIVDGAFLVIVSAFVWREVIVGKNWRNAPVCIMITLFAAGNLLWHGGHLLDAPRSLSIHWGLSVVAILLALIGGRITPSFTRNWLAKRGGASSIAGKVTRVDKAALGLIAVAMTLWTALPQSTITAWALIAASGVHFFRLAQWDGLRTMSEPLVAILHVGYLWLPVSLLLLGASMLAPSTIPPLSSLHALTAGAMGVMILAVMTRATRGHTGRTLTADGWTVVIFAMVNLGAVLRVAAPFLPTSYATSVFIAAILWSGAYLLFAVVYGRYLMGPRVAA